MTLRADPVPLCRIWICAALRPTIDETKVQAKLEVFLKLVKAARLVKTQEEPSDAEHFCR